MTALAARLGSGWMSPSVNSIAESVRNTKSSSASAKYIVVDEMVFNALAESAPIELINLVRADVLEPHDLTYAAEALGRIADEKKVAPILLRLLSHASAVVREGAVYGLGMHLSKKVVKKLQKVHRGEPSPGVRQAIEEVLADSHS